MTSLVSQVLDSFAGGHNCCQAVLAAYGEIHGLNRETALKLGAGMGGGVGHSGELCGFVSAACLVLGLKHGTDAPESKLKLNPICLEFCNAFGGGLSRAGLPLRGRDDARAGLVFLADLTGLHPGQTIPCAFDQPDRCRRDDPAPGQPLQPGDLPGQ